MSVVGGPAESGGEARSGSTVRGPERRKDKRAAAPFDEVFAAELARTAERRRRVGPSVPPLAPGDGGRPSASLQLGGIALSGGGIRSATFNLGLLQALGQNGALEWCDYLSTVSGGGYIGSCFTSLLTDPEAGPDKARFPFRYDGEVERAEVQHLRHHRTYLAPRHGLFRADTWRLVSSYVAGLWISLATMLSLLGAAAACGILLYPWLYARLASLTGVHGLDGHDLLGHPDDHLAVLLAPAIGSGALWFLASMSLLGFGTLAGLPRGTRSRIARYQGLLLGFTVVLAILGLLPSLLARVDALVRGGFRFPAYWTALGLSALTLVRSALLGERAPSVSSKLKRTVVLLGLSIFVVLLCLGVLYLVWTQRHAAWAVLGACAIVLLSCSIFFRANDISMFHFYRDRLSEAYLVTRKPPARRSRRRRPDPAGESPRTTLYANDRLLLSEARSERGPLHLVNATVNLPGSDEPALLGRRSDLFTFSPLFCGSRITGYRETPRYRNGRVTLADAMAISGAAANPQYGAATNRVLAFLMSLLNVRLGAWFENPRYPSPRWTQWLAEARGNAPGRPTRGVGGAAREAAAHVGLDALEWVAYLTRGLVRFWPYYLVSELLSQVDEKSRMVNLSDGGHIENLGVYELLRRRCSLIVASDAGADPERKFSDFGNLLRLARIDLGVQITIDLGPLRPDSATGLAEKHLVTGEIRYPLPGGGSEKGTLVYVKAALRSQDPEDLHAYRRLHPSFPHESTADQFFDEAQFESYRELGYRCGKAVVEGLAALGSREGGGREPIAPAG